MKKQSKSAQIRALLAEGKSVDEIAKAVKCTKKLVYVVRSQWGKEPKDWKPAEPLFVEISAPDMVNHPPHYNVGGIEVIEAIEAWGLNYRLGNVVKYVARAESKGNYLEDLKKARWYLDREITKSEEI